VRIWQGKHPFSPDKTHIHHLLTNNGWSHYFTNKLICTVHAGILVLTYFLKRVPQELGLLILVAIMLLTVIVFRKIKPSHPSSIYKIKAQEA
jgi:hypothetical protein